MDNLILRKPDEALGRSVFEATIPDYTSYANARWRTFYKDELTGATTLRADVLKRYIWKTKELVSKSGIYHSSPVFPVYAIASFDVIRMEIRMW